MEAPKCTGAPCCNDLSASGANRNTAPFTTCLSDWLMSEVGLSLLDIMSNTGQATTTTTSTTITTRQPIAKRMCCGASCDWWGA
ncbi:hypothetical protein E2C01_071655 [Portunus trituberculatus]|uniref:Uncharacterized protein n=1 Tax=Portunus trituberculatus TaxID=210409 RepID=A0A5B7I6T3_PORTR|nr:hypothetical protein [Portunus trituberculatus]